MTKASVLISLAAARLTIFSDFLCVPFLRAFLHWWQTDFVRNQRELIRSPTGNTLDWSTAKWMQRGSNPSLGCTKTTWTTANVLQGLMKRALCLCNITLAISGCTTVDEGGADHTVCFNYCGWMTGCWTSRSSIRPSSGGRRSHGTSTSPHVLCGFGEGGVASEVWGVSTLQSL